MAMIYEIVFSSGLLPDWTVFLTGYVSYGMGCGFGIGALRWPKFGVLAVGATIGFITGKLFDIALLQPFVPYDSPSHSISTWCFIVIACILSVFFFEHAVIICSCMCGSYIFFRVSNPCKPQNS